MGTRQEPSSETPYVVLQTDEETPVVAQPVQVVVIETVKKRKRTVCGGCGCCCLILLLVLLLSLLLPRSPAIHFGSLGVTKSEDDVFTIAVDLNFKSRQPIESKWKDLEVKLQWRQPVDDDEAKQVEVAKFEKSDSFKTKAFGKKHVYPGLTYFDLSATSQLYAYCFLDEAQVRSSFQRCTHPLADRLGFLEVDVV
ncbi:hypothetical protein CTAYLR_010763 [Chrysophaeum taylorii]|uniref:Uncharacterized protein n=1 Tax=Chrysophaeum taylorii TaxID=2483200 RepID=A0AAD7U7U4_9STRA|nr:hypothetical protein CTAYLR_010763 [Chrysophaeum taylorii]